MTRATHFVGASGVIGGHFFTDAGAVAHNTDGSPGVIGG